MVFRKKLLLKKAKTKNNDENITNGSLLEIAKEPRLTLG